MKRAPNLAECDSNSRGPSEPEEHDIAARTLWIFVAVAISAVEALIPRIPLFPWLKPGFSNAVTILWIIRYGTVDALLFSFLRVWISGFYVGFSLFSLGLGLCGAACATLSMGLLWKLLGRRRWLGTVGLGICGACFHNAGQLVALALLLKEAEKLLVQVPVMLAASLVFGGLTGWMVVPLGRLLAARSYHHLLPDRVNPQEGRISRISLLASIGILAVSLGLLAIQQVSVLGACAVLATILAVAVTGSFSAVLRRGILRFWMLFFFIAFTNLLHPSGTILWHLPFLTREAALDTACQWLRLWSWLALAALLTKAHFDRVLFSVLSKVFRRHGATLAAASAALVHFSVIFTSAVDAAKSLRKSGRRSPRSLARAWLETTLDGIERQLEKAGEGAETGELRS
jgi:heptaprenyl diphosphate synthase